MSGLKRTVTMITFLVIMVMSAEALQSIVIPPPYLYMLDFEELSSTPEFKDLMRLEELKEEIKRKKPVRIDIEGHALASESKALAGERAEYVSRWLKSGNINAHISVKASEKSGTHFYNGGESGRHVMIRVYDQKMIYARQDAQRIAREKAAGRPSLYANARIYSFGTVVEGDMLEHEFIIRNSGDADLEIKNVKTDCGCTAVSFSEKISPGKAGSVKIAVDTKGDGNKKIKRKIRVRTNDPDVKTLEFAVTGYVEKFVEISPASLWISGKAGEAVERRIKVKPLKKYPFIIKKVESTNKEIFCELLDDKGDGCYRVLVSVAGTKKGRYNGDVIVTTDSKVRSELKINVVVKIR